MTHMKKIITLALALGLVSSVAIAQPKPGQYTGVRQCQGSLKGIDVDVTSKRTIGVATCKGEIQKKLVAEGVCSGLKKGTRLEYSFKFGKDGEPDQATGTSKLSCP